ncbi:MAG: hypothetical protein ACKO96_27450, partial [Flammeovirgaceae bacterium]
RHPFQGSPRIILPHYVELLQISLESLRIANFREEHIPQHNFGNGNRQTRGYELPPIIKPLQFVIALPLQRFYVLPRKIAPAKTDWS